MFVKKQHSKDLIDYFKIVNNLNIVAWYNPNPPSCSAYNTRGHSLRTTRQITTCLSTNHFLSNRIAPLWNNLRELFQSPDWQIFTYHQFFLTLFIHIHLLSHYNYFLIKYSLTHVYMYIKYFITCLKLVFTYVIIYINLYHILYINWT